MITACLTIIGSILALVFYEIKRSNARQDDPAVQNQNRYAKAEKDLVKRDDIKASVNGADDLDALDRLHNS